MDLFADPRLERLKGKLPTKSKTPSPAPTPVPSVASSSNGPSNRPPPQPSTSSSSLPKPNPSIQVKTVVTKINRLPPPSTVAVAVNGKAKEVSVGSKRKLDGKARDGFADIKKPKPNRPTTSTVSLRTASPKPRPNPSSSRPSRPPSSPAVAASESSSSDDGVDPKKRKSNGNGTGTGGRGTPVGGGAEGHAMTSAARRYERYIARPVAFTPPSPALNTPRPPDPIAEPTPIPEAPSRQWMSSEELVAPNRAAFKHWFRSLSDSAVWPPVGTPEGGDPMVEVEYPGGGRERFPLLVPRINDDEYRPLDDLMRVIRTVLGYFLTADQCQTHFSESHPITSASSTSSQFSFLSAPSQRSSLPPRSSRSPSAVPAVGGGLTVPSGGEESSRGTTPLLGESTTPAGSSPFPMPAPTAEEQTPTEDDLSHIPLLQTLDRARRRQDGPRFVQLISWYNRVITHLRSTGALSSNIASMPGLRLDVWDVVLRQAYERRVGPSVDDLRKYEAFSDNVYGELRPPFVSDILHLVDLGPGKVMVDLGSGVGNCVVQAALESGCTAVGFENMPTASRLATEQRHEVIHRSQALWGISPGPISVFEADFTSDPRVGEWLRKADVLLVNNQVFTPSLNEKLSLLFLDLKDECKIVSLKPFVPHDFRLTGRTVDSPHAVLDQGKPRRYAQNSVSWTGKEGQFYIAAVDRSRVERFFGGAGAR